MTRINTNVESLRGLHNVQKAQKQLSTSLQRLSTGLQINSGRDNPAGLIASEGLRLQITTIEQSIKNSNRANNVLATADSALGEIGGLLNQVRGLVQEALNSGALSSDEIKANQQQIDQALSAINRIAANTSFAGQKLIDGSKAFTTSMSAADAAKISDLQINEALFGSSSTISVNTTVTTAATKGELRYNDGTLSSAVTLEVAGSKGNQVLFLGGSSTVGNIRDAVNAVSDVTGVEATLRAGAVIGGSGGSVKFTDARPEGTAGTISVVFADPGAASSPLSIGVAGNVITVNLATDGGGAITSTAADVVAAIQGDTSASALVNVKVETAGVVAAQASTNLTAGDDAELVLKSVNFGSKEFVQLNVLSGTFATTLDDGTTASYRDSGSDIQAIVNGQAALGDGLNIFVKNGMLDAMISLRAASNVANTTATVTITGGGSLFQIGQQADASGQIGVGIDAVNTARLGGVSGKLYQLGTGGGKSLLDVGPNVPGSELVEIIDQALNRVNTLRGRLGAIQKDVIDTNISNLGVALENISSARSQIVDTDFAAETAALQKAQVLSQAGISVLTIANQVPQQVLALLR
jgi:flagellin